MFSSNVNISLTMINNSILINNINFIVKINTINH